MTDRSQPGTYSSTFPEGPPADITSPETVAAHDQAAFHSLTRLLCHWDRPHRTSYQWLLPMAEHRDAVQLAERCQAHLPQHGLDHIPAEWLHMTFSRLGYEGEMSLRQAKQAARQTSVKAQDLDPFTVDLIPLAGSPGAVRLSVAPWQPLMELYKIASPGDTEPLERFRPHVGIAYSATAQASAPVSAAVRAAASAETSISIIIRELTLVRLRRANGWYEWDEIAVAKLGCTQSQRTKLDR